MGRQAAAVSSPPPAAVQSPPTMPPLPPRPPKKRYLLENPPRPASGLLQLAEVSSPPPVGPPPPVSSTHGGRQPPPYLLQEEMPLNLTTAATTEVKLSRIVDRVVEKMLKKGGMDNGKSGDPLRLWFTNQFETRQRSESGSSPSPGQKSASPQLPSPAAAGSPDQPSPGQLEPAADQAGLTELRIGMSDTINRVIDNVYRQRPEVTSCSSDSVSTTGLPQRLGRRAQRLQRLRRPPALELPPAKRCRTGADRLAAPVGEDCVSPPLRDEARPTAVISDAPDSRSSEASPVVADQSPAAAPSPGSPPRRPRKRNPATDSRTGERAASATGTSGGGSRKRKVGKEEIVRIQQEQTGSPSATVVSDTNARSKSQPK